MRMFTNSADVFNGSTVKCSRTEKLPTHHRTKKKSAFFLWGWPISLQHPCQTCINLDVRLGNNGSWQVMQAEMNLKIWDKIVNYMNTTTSNTGQRQTLELNETWKCDEATETTSNAAACKKLPNTRTSSLISLSYLACLFRRLNKSNCDKHLKCTSIFTG